MVERTDLDKVWLVVSPQNPLKVSHSLLNEYDRLRMVELAIGDNPGLQASNVEFSLPKPSYTIDTLNHLEKTYPCYDFSILMGEDNLRHLHKWKAAGQIATHYHIYVYPRPGNYKPMQMEAQTTRVDAPYLELSSSDVRQRIKQGHSIRYYVPEVVAAYIRQHQLYV